MEKLFKLCDTLRMSRETAKQVIRRHRKALGLSQKELAAEIGMTDRIVSTWETGRGRPSIESLRKLANLFGIGIDDFNLTEEESRRINTIVEETPNPELATILDEIRDEGKARPDIAQSLRDWFAGWRARGDGDRSR